MRRVLAIAALILLSGAAANVVIAANAPTQSSTGEGIAIREEAGKFSGALLWTLLEKAVLIDGPGKGALLRHVITVIKRDGYAVVLSAGELAPNFEGKAVILAFAKDGRPLKPEERIRFLTNVAAVRIPVDCTDGFTEAFHARPERFLDPAVRHSQSAWRFVSDDVQERFARTLGEDLRSGEWDRRYGRWHKQNYFEGSLRRIVRRLV